MSSDPSAELTVQPKAVKAGPETSAHQASTDGDAIDYERRLWRATAPQPQKAAKQSEAAFEEYRQTRPSGESPSILFSCTYYLTQLPVFLRSSIDPLDHYLRIGWKLGLAPHFAFDSSYVAEQLGVQSWAEPPLIAYFESEREVSAHPLFDLEVYGARVNLDTENFARLFEMFLDSWLVARAPFSRLFSYRYYEWLEPAAGLGSVNPLVHYLSTDLGRRRDPNPMIHNQWYDLQYPAKPGQPRDPLVRFAKIGLKEGHSPNPFAISELKLLDSEPYISRDLLLDYVDATQTDRWADCGGFLSLRTRLEFGSQPASGTELGASKRRGRHPIAADQKIKNREAVTAARRSD